jgi:hypothetical protein
VGRRDEDEEELEEPHGLRVVTELLVQQPEKL